MVGRKTGHSQTGKVVALCEDSHTATHGAFGCHCAVVLVHLR